MNKQVTKWINNEPTWLISPVVPIVNRQQRRDYMRQAENINKSLNEVESSFISYLFDIPNINSYENLHLQHQEWFLKKVVWLKANGNLKNAQINEKYFVDKFKSVKL